VLRAEVWLFLAAALDLVRCSTLWNLVRLHAPEAGATKCTALEPGLMPALSLTLPASAALTANTSTEAEDSTSSTPEEAIQEQQQRQKRRVEHWLWAFGEWSAQIRCDRGSRTACACARAARVAPVGQGRFG